MTRPSRVRLARTIAASTGIGIAVAPIAVLSAAAVPAWASAPTGPNLPVAGFPFAQYGIGALVLIVAGAAIAWAGRRRQS
jgi:tellurite resistance protein TehA-like permease